ncbi:hypothetical protein [Nitrospira moscoviensis]|uniref:Uncharacterized protein n=1 Tax=Nitrospira moscoviensis TaxID=42253 RepID=A0A0K2GF01_NITMO|nr:hypothetical protein [Nitrospira moscoviensis]ALA59538.1 hypothetical protein NITMOv2_3139 [Nitrospira moscoviensis]
MNRFDDLLQRITLLNTQLQPVKDHLGSDTRKMLYVKLWSIVGELNAMLHLGLDNTALDLKVDGHRIIIHYWSGVGGSVETEVSVFIDRSFAVQRHTKNLATGNVTMT